MMSCAEEVVYQVVKPGEPEQNCRCCLNGVNVNVASVVGAGGAVLRAFVGGSRGPTVDSEMVGPLVAGGLEPDVSCRTRKNSTRAHLDP